MRILKVKLKNVKSYGDEAPEIEFAPGTNFLSGVNGAGKSTISEAIGYALYNFMPYDRKEDFIRRGARTGVITVWIEDANETFRIERKFGATNSWVVYDKDDVDLHSKQDDVMRFLCERLRLPDPGQLANVFENIIGVPQGRFTHIFTEARAQRKATFDAIINVDLYRRSADTRGDVKNRMVELEIERVDGELKAARQYLDEHEEDPKKLAEAKQRIANLAEQIQTLQKQRDLLESRKRELDRAKRKIEEIERSIEGIEKSIEERNKARLHAQEELKRSRAAAEVCARTLQAHRAFLQVASELDALEKLREQRDGLQRKHSDIASRIASDAASLEAENRNLSSDRASEKECLDGVQRRLADWKELNAMAEALEADARKAKSEADRQTKEVEELAEREEDFSRRLTRAQGEARRVRECLQEAAGFEETLKAYDRTRALADTLKEARAKEKGAANRIATLEEELRQHEENRKLLASLVCPFIKESCDRVKPEVLQARIAPIREKLKAAERQLEEARRAAEAADDARHRMTELDEIKNRLREVRRQRTRAWHTARELLEGWMAPWGSYPSFPAEGDGELDLSPFEAYGAGLKAELQRRRTELKKMSSAETAAEKAAASARSRANAAEERRVEAEQRLQRIRGTIGEREEKIRVLTRRLAEAKKTEAALSGDLASFADLEDKLRDARERRDSTRAGYDEYVRNERAAGELDRRRKHLDQVAGQLAEAESRLKERQSERAEASKLYDAEEAARVEKDFDRAGQGLSAAQTGYKNLEAEVGRLDLIVKTMAEKRVKIGMLEQERAQLGFFRELLGVIWKILREVGPRISARLLAGISARANRIFGVLHGNGSQLVWGQDYEVRLKSGSTEYAFKNLSGGEQMCAALAIQMAMARDFAGSSFCIFDEPTIHLDETRRQRLASVVREAQVDAGFTQVFIVSHDDTFGPYVDHEVKLQKGASRGTEVVV